VPHDPDTTNGTDRLPNVKSGSTSDTLSAAFSGAVNSKANEMGVAACVTGLPIVKLLYVSVGVAILVDDEMPTAAMLDDSDVSITWTVREARFAACATELVVTPVAIMTVHIVYGNSVATPVVKVIEGVPVLDPTAEKVVVPQPLVEADRDATKMKLGRTSFMESVPTANGTLSANVNEIADGAPVTAFSIINELCCRVGTAGAVTAVDEAIGVDIGMLVASARVAPTLRDGVSVACAIALVVTPDDIVISQRTPALIVATDAVNVRVAVAKPEFVPIAANVVLPQPFVVGVETNPDTPPIAKLKSGSNKLKLSLAFRGAFISNEKESDDSALVSGLYITKLLYENVGASMALDTSIGVESICLCRIVVICG